MLATADSFQNIQDMTVADMLNGCTPNGIKMILWGRKDHSWMELHCANMTKIDAQQTTWGISGAGCSPKAQLRSHHLTLSKPSIHHIDSGRLGN